MKVVVISAILLALCYGNTLAHGNSEAESETENEDEQTSSIGHSFEASNNASYSGRIVNGKQGDIAKFPFIVRMRVNNVGKCGASVITLWHAFTAGHCAYNIKDPSTVTLYGGSTSQSSGGVVFNVANIFVHPQYNDKTLDYDASIIKVKNSFQGHKNIAPIQLQDVEVPYLTTCTVIGWGWTKFETKATPDNLQYAQLQVVSQTKCDTSYTYLPQETICASEGNRINVCHGDSGGPLVCNGKLTGATSFVGPACRSQTPAGFVKVTAPSIRKFIRKTAGV